MTSLPQYLQQNPRNGCPVEEKKRAQITSPPLYGKKKISYQREFRDIAPDNTINKHCYTSRTCKPNYETNNLSSTCSLNTAFHRHAPRYEQRLRTGQYQQTRIALLIKYKEKPKENAKKLTRFIFSRITRGKRDSGDKFRRELQNTCSYHRVRFNWSFPPRRKPRH